MESDINSRGFPRQALSFSSKTKNWRKKCLDWADSKTYNNYELCRKTIKHKKINYDLIKGKLHIDDLGFILNPSNVQAQFVSKTLQHYPIINSKLNVLKGEEAKRTFDFKVVVTNPTAISEVEENKKALLQQMIQQDLADSSQSEEEFNNKLAQYDDFFSHDFQDEREIRANFLLNHYIKEYNIPMILNEGFSDSMIVGEEIYQCDIICGEPVIRRLNPLKIRVLQSAYSNRIEDADMIIIEDYWPVGKIIDVYHEELSNKDIKYLDNLPNQYKQVSDSMGNLDERYGYINADDIADNADYVFNAAESNTNSLPYDNAGNVRVLQVYWKSKRKIKKVKFYDPDTGEATFDFFPETYIIDKNKGEEEEIYYINEAWEGTKIGEDIYVNMRPRVVQYNRLSNPSRCHFGIIGNIYNLNDSKPFSFVDMMKPYNYLYDVIHDRLNKLLARNWGSLIRFDLAKKPQSWDVDKWFYYAKTLGVMVENNFNEGSSGAALGKLAGGLNNASTGIISDNVGNQIQQYINLLEYIKNEMSEVVGISKQREGQISNRETVGGVERATLQSSYITEWIFYQHEDLKKRVYECMLETAKAALKGRNKKFQYILPDGSLKLIDIDGDEFAEADYGLIVDNSAATQEFNQKLDMLAQAALQNQTLSFSTVMKLYSTASTLEKQRCIEKNEQELQQRQQEQLQQQQQLEQQKIEQDALLQQNKMDQEYKIAQERNETNVLIAQINSQAEAQRYAVMDNNQAEEQKVDNDKRKLEESIRQFDAKLKLDKLKADRDYEIKKKQLNKNTNTK